MPSNSPPRKEHSSVAADLENGDRRELDSARPRPWDEEGGSGNASSQLPGRSEGMIASRPWYDTPRWKAVKSKIPSPLARWTRIASNWLQGPKPPRRNRIKPLFEPVQTFHIRLLARLPRFFRICIFVCAFFVWIIPFGVLLNDHGLPSDIAGFGAPIKLSCTNKLWPDAPSCGIDGRNCLPFDNSTFAFSCPADCSLTTVLNPKTVGDISFAYRPFIVGGGTPQTPGGNDFVYRGDSFICGSAIHAGALSDNRGGCGVISLVGARDEYDGVSRNGMSSIGFNSSFPLSFNFDRSERVERDSGKCNDPRWNLLVLSIVLSAAFSLFTTHPATFFGPVFAIAYWQIAMASDPQPYNDYPSLASNALGKFLPAAFVAVVIYQTSVRKTLHHLTAQYEKTILWIGALWVGALNNLTFDHIPISRLTPHDLNQQPGAMTALIIIILVLFAIVLYQAWCFRAEGRLLRFLGLYITLGLGLVILIGIPSLSLRIHHYILALLLLPGTALQTRASLLFQGLLVGLFINGIARWGFDSILQTAAALRGDAQLGSELVSILPPNITNATSIAFTWAGLARGYEGVSVLVNDVERFRGFSEDGQTNFTWTKRIKDKPEYFRFGFVNYAPFGGVSYSDFTRAGIWWPNGSWSDIPEGRTSG
ncbi:hypothetical protein DM02DRAFT_613759 [Periconia macrospinosa]|uniref:LCCL domain-containing protein n=1 Tax=Periconia macrospinosa TaxID=97972 RepID=A0A2V1DSY0_9PLEO|nr:hypothetical protein DM02DRAFT_613759 [Periconia macrospinosa]